MSERHYSEEWDLSTIPADAWASEHGRRNRAKAPRAPNLKLKPCPNCSEPLSARERDYGGICPKCGSKGLGRKK
jgi:Zn finger protein HypA/HybF involved in hydrogenase expression